MRYLVGLSAICMTLGGAVAIAQQNQFPLAAPVGVGGVARAVQQQLTVVWHVDPSHHAGGVSWVPRRVGGRSQPARSGGVQPGEG